MAYTKIVFIALISCTIFFTATPTANAQTAPISVLFPNGGEQLTIGNSYNIKWQAAEDIWGIQLLKNGAPVQELNPASTENYIPWKVPVTVSPGNDYKIRVKGKSNYDDSNTSFSIVLTQTQAPTVDFTVIPNVTTSYAPILLQWQSTNADSCTADTQFLGASWPSPAHWWGKKALSGNETLYAGDTKYILKCTNAAGTTEKTVTVSISQNPPAQTASGPLPVIDLAATPNPAVKDTPVQLKWSASNAISCVAGTYIAGPVWWDPYVWSGSKSISGGSESIKATNATYTLTCLNSNGRSEKSVAVSTANAAPAQTTPSQALAPQISASQPTTASSPTRPTPITQITPTPVTPTTPPITPVAPTKSQQVTTVPSSDATLSLIAQLQAQIAALQAKVAELQASPPPNLPEVPQPMIPTNTPNKIESEASQAEESGPPILFTRSLFLGSRGEDVRQLQQLLAELGLYPENLVTGFFGPITRRAVIQFQEKFASEILVPVGLSGGTGFVGSGTLKKLNSLIALSSQSEEELRANSRKINTESAVKQLQIGLELYYDAKGTYPVSLTEIEPYLGFSINKLYDFDYEYQQQGNGASYALCYNTDPTVDMCVKP